MRKLLSIARNGSLFICVLCLLFFVIVTSNQTTEITTHNINSARSVQAAHLVSKYNPKVTTVKTVTTFQDVLKYGAKNPVKFNGVMTGYGPDCAGCGGHVACSPGQNVTGGNIYFKDNTYGKVNILAASPSIPCGSIVKISNSTLSKGTIVAIVLDRGGAIQGTKMDFLDESEAKAMRVGKQTVTYEIVRWGW